ncbi:MAG: hypothetical protein KAU01_01730 [Candidatus Cloacimonetes bacterium]|nr:hypothetical protein [Candidatus Cloacimonadota bacterium]
MATYTIKDFKKGDRVYHLSNDEFIMVAIEIHENANEISCQWIDKNGEKQCAEFMPEELGKTEDLRLGIYST